MSLDKSYNFIIGDTGDIKTYRLALLLKNETSAQAQRTRGLDCTILNAKAYLLTPDRINAPYRAVSHVRVCVVEQV